MFFLLLILIPILGFSIPARFSCSLPESSMEKEDFALADVAGASMAAWNCLNFSPELQKCSPEQRFPMNSNWEAWNMGQGDPFESSLSSMVSSPATGAGAVCGLDNNIVMGEVIGRLGSICNSGDISPPSHINSTNGSCYSTPLNSPPKLNLSDHHHNNHQIRGSLPVHGNQFSVFAPFPADPGFAERAARFSCFGNGSLELGKLVPPKVESDKLSRVSNGSQTPNLHGPVSDRKLGRSSGSSTPENGEESSISEQIPGGVSVSGVKDGISRKRKSIPRGKAKEIQIPAKTRSDNEESKAKRSKSNESSGDEKATSGEPSGNGKAARDGKNKENAAKPPEPPKDYIHVRARRGQATDSHSLAERVRREKISERMKFLQDLVPGCNKLTGKAVMLDEIINYVQALQNQVEFLSMKLANVNPELSGEALLSKDMIQSCGSSSQSLYPFDSSAIYGLQSQQGSSLPGNITGGQFSINSFNAAMNQNPSMQLPQMSGLEESAPQFPTFWQDDLQRFVQMGFGQNEAQAFHGSVTPPQMKVEQQ